MRSELFCQRCEKRPGGKWDGTGGYSRLCGSCKVRVCVDQPGFKERLELDMREAMIFAGAVADEIEECIDCGGSTAVGTPDPHVCAVLVKRIVPRALTDVQRRDGRGTP